VFASLLMLAVLMAGQANDARSRTITIYLAGDSTMAQKLPEKRPETGWGEKLAGFFQDGKVTIENRAQNGRSTRTFIEEGRWQAIVEQIQPGDYVFIQFGHNDESKEKVDRYTPPADYRNNLIRFITEVRGKKGFPILLTPVMRRRFDRNGVLQDSHGEYPGIVRSVATEYEIPLIDMHRDSGRILKLYGPEESRKLFLQLKPNENPNYPKGIEDNTHFNPVGAEVMASLAVAGIRESKLGLVKYLKRQR
jgi:lysophospholipase L1-like esterase